MHESEYGFEQGSAPEGGSLPPRSGAVALLGATVAELLGTLARAVIWTVGVLTGVPKVRLLANTLACLGNTGTMSIACIATHKWIVDSIAVGTLTSLASSVDLYCIWR